ncbi:MAG: acyltransferase [Sporomusa sphaeroides]
MRIVNLLKKIVRRLTVSRNHISSLVEGNIQMDSTAKVALHNILTKNDCLFRIGKKSIFEGHIYFEREGASVIIGDRTFVGGSSILCAENITIGDDVLIAFGITIADHNSHSIYFEERANDVEMWYEGKKDWTYVKMHPVKICNKAWIGMHSIILKGVTIGEGAVIGAGSVVTRDVPPYTVVAGNPARPICTVQQSEGEKNDSGIKV